MEGMFLMMIEQAKLSDEMFEKYGIEEEEFTNAVIFHKLMHDQDILHLGQENAKRMGFPGMGGHNM
jgi:sugar (pentulose or hexulose) kinase